MKNWTSFRLYWKVFPILNLFPFWRICGLISFVTGIDFCSPFGIFPFTTKHKYPHTHSLTARNGFKTQSKFFLSRHVPIRHIIPIVEVVCSTWRHHKLIQTLTGVGCDVLSKYLRKLFGQASTLTVDGRLERFL